MRVTFGIEPLCVFAASLWNKIAICKHVGACRKKRLLASCLSVRLSTCINAVPAGPAVLKLCSADPKRSTTSSQAIRAYIYEMANLKCAYVCN